MASMRMRKKAPMDLVGTEEEAMERGRGSKRIEVNALALKPLSTVPPKQPISL
jgi:hypothetical protein